MKALVKTGKGVGLIEVRDVPQPTVKNDEDVLIRVTGSGICGTDLHIEEDQFPYWPPVILGHEFVGVVEQVGKAVTNVKVGDRVVGEPHTLACGKCELCREGHPQMCKTKRSPGWGIDGADAPYICYPQPDLLHKVPDNVPDNVAVLAEPMSVVVHAVVERTRVEQGNFVVISGAGPIGLLSAVAAQACGASKVVMFGTDPDEELRFKVARELGVARTVNVMKENPVDVINEMTNGRGADVIIECSGAAPAINTAIDVAKTYGKIGVIAIPGPEKISVQWAKMVHKCLTVELSFSSSYTAWNRTIQMMANAKVDLSKIVTHRVPLEDWKKTFDDIRAGRCIKGVFIPD